MFHGATDRHFIVNSVTKTGGSLNLAKGQWAVVDIDAQPTQDGQKIISDFDGLSKKSRVQLFSGSPDLNVNRSYSNKSNRTLPFHLSDIQEIRVSAPKEGIKVDHQVLGFNGTDGTEIVLEPGDDQEISLMLSGPALGILGYKDAAVQITERLTAPSGDKSVSAVPAAGEWTDQQVVEEAVDRLNNTIVMGSVKLTDYVDITPVNSLNAAPIGTDQVFYNLTVSDGGTYSDLGAVQGQYPDLQIKRSETLGDGSVYTAIAGALPADYTVNKAWKVKGCADCPTGYTELADGLVYSVQLEDDGVDSALVVEAISAFVTAGTAVKVNEEGGLSTYTVVTTDEITQAELDAFLVTNPEAVVEQIAPDVAEVCSPDNLVTITWVAGDTCKVQTETYTLTVGHDECGVAIPTSEIEAFYPGLTIAVDSTIYCATVYSTTVTTNVVCEECSPAFRALFTSEAPKNYGVHAWQKESKTYNGTAKMGISFKAKPFVFAGSEVYRDYVPSLATSTRLQVAGGYVVDVNSSFKSGGPTGNDYKVTILSVASEPENWGMNLRNWEESSRISFNGECRFYHNNYGNLVTGKETNLEAVQPYVDYVIKVRTSTTGQGVPGERELVDIHDYHMIVAPGVHKDVEDVLNGLALQAGVSPVQAFGTR